ncbi:LysR family transcriptional regulator [Vibrio paucivorans]
MARNLYDNLDLNLLRVFFVLFQEKNTRKAAERLFVTQPAVSKSLTKLRQTFDDELFVKHSKGIVPTPYAEDLYQSLRPLMFDLEHTLNSKEDFNPANLDEQIVIAISPFLMSALATNIYTEIRKQAPNVSVLFQSWNQDTQSEIESGKVCFGISYDFHVPVHKSLYSTKIAQDRFRIVCREDHPHKGETISPLEATKYPVGTILAPNWNYYKPAAEILADSLGIKFNIVLRSEFPSVLLEAVRTSDMMAAVSKFSDYEFVNGIKLLEFDWDHPLETPDIYSYYHYKNHNTQKTQWLASILKRVMPD